VAAFSDAIHTCPARRLATAARGPVYRYVYAHTLEGSELLSRLGPGHFLDEALLWQDARLLHAFGVPFYEFTEADEGLSGQMTAYWTNFAATGDPNGRRLPEWPAYDSAAEESCCCWAGRRAPWAAGGARSATCSTASS
jgi:para-nitrobenzyl esterase